MPTYTQPPRRAPDLGPTDGDQAASVRALSSRDLSFGGTGSRLRSHPWDTQYQMALDAAVIPFPERTPGDASRPSFSVSDERLIRRVLAVLNAETGYEELGYESRARLYFYLGFQRYAALRWLSVLSVQGHGYEWQLGRRISANLQGLMSPHVLEHDAMEEPMYREMVLALSGEMFGLLRLAHDQIYGRGRPPVSQMGHLPSPRET